MWLLVQRFLALLIFLVLLPLLLICSLAVWLCDGHNPFYVPLRVGKDGVLFKMFKLRTMRIDTTKNNLVATALNDARITLIGRLLRRYKIDECLQLINVIKGDMLLIGPRPQLLSEYNSFTQNERKIVTIHPGMSDISSIFFSKMEHILASHKDPYVGYLTLCRPVKSRLALFYVKHRSIIFDLFLLILNGTNFISHSWTVEKLAQMVKHIGDCDVPYDVLIGKKPLYPRNLP